MRVHLHTVCWNDAPMLDFFFRHYDWVDKFFMLDDGSTDGSLELLSARENVEVRRLERIDPTSWVNSARHTYNTDWKRSRGQADWVIVGNVDEHLHHPNMRAYLQRQLAAGATVIPADGYQMITDSFPAPGSVLHSDFPMGAPDGWMNRIGLFRPDRIAETNFTVGRHGEDLVGEVRFARPLEVANLHYKYLGLERTHARHQALAARLGALDLKNGWGHKYLWSREELRADFEAARAAALDTRFIDRSKKPRLTRWRKQG